MALTVNNMQVVQLLNIMGRISERQNNLLTQLTTGKLINRASDNPAGLVAVANMDAELTAVTAAISNGQRADAMLDVADGALSEISSLLSDIEELAAASTSEAGLSASELAANQAQIDQAVLSIDRIVRTTSFNGKKLLDGSFAIRTTGVDATKLADVRVYNRPSASTSTTLSVSLTSAASKATKTSYATTSATTATTISITGELGTAIIDIAAGENLSSVAYKINQATAETGVTASSTAASLSLLSQEYGTGAFVTVEHLSGDSTNYGASARTSGSNAVVTVNGQTAAVDGLDVNFNNNGLSLSFTLTEDYNDGTVTGSESFTVAEGGATFQLGTDSLSRATLGLNGLYSHLLGSSDLGYLSSIKGGGDNDLNTDPSQAVAVIKKAVQQVALARGRVGGFQKFQVTTSINALTATQESLQQAKSVIEDTDYAQATSELNRQQVLMGAAISLLAIANSQAQSVLSLLR